MTVGLPDLGVLGFLLVVLFTTKKFDSIKKFASRKKDKEE
jgi:hypothetical protein